MEEVLKGLEEVLKKASRFESVREVSLRALRELKSGDVGIFVDHRHEISNVGEHPDHRRLGNYQVVVITPQGGLGIEDDGRVVPLNLRGRTTAYLVHNGRLVRIETGIEPPGEVEEVKERLADLPEEKRKELEEILNCLERKNCRALFITHILQGPRLAAEEPTDVGKVTYTGVERSGPWYVGGKGVSVVAFPGDVLVLTKEGGVKPLEGASNVHSIIYLDIGFSEGYREMLARITRLRKLEGKEEHKS